MEIKTWADFGALTKEELDSYTPEDLEALKSSIKQSEDSLSKQKDEDLKKSKEYGENQKIRAEKAEKEAKEKKDPGFSEADVIALSRAKLHDDDLDEVRNYAKFKNISVSDAIKDKTLKNILDIREEERRSAAAAAAGGGGGGAQRPSNESLLQKASQEELPEKDEDIEALAEARMEEKKKRLAP